MTEHGGGEVALRRGGLIDWLDPLLAQRGATLDHSQAAAVTRLQSLSDELAAFRAARTSRLKRLLNPPEVPRGVYLWGGVGRGKSFLMDAFHATVPIRRKTRVHFHAFMRGVHEELQTLKNEADPLLTVAARIAQKWRLVCFDEFHVSDIADAMILARLLTALFDAGVVFVMTSNYPPSGLYPDGLQRQNFVPTVALIEQWLDIIEVDGGTDYRLRAMEQVSTYHVPLGSAADRALAAAYERMRSGPDEDVRLLVQSRPLAARRRSGNAVWFDFTTLCEGPRSQRDYLELAEHFSVLFVSDIPRLAAAASDAARRFTWLVDILYDHRVKLLVSAAAAPAELYVSGPHSHEFMRTASRLTEMQTREYMSERHIASAGATHG
ncbi:MAG: cell division protein ZapE [Pseudomonadota bacterium]|nr:cell division protein ZapE [Pseudomonadota bacterium]